MCNDADHRTRAQIFCARGAGHDQGCRSVVNSGGVARGDGTIFLERWLERAQDFDRGVLARTLVLVKDHGRLALFLGRNFNRNDLRFKPAFLLRGNRLAVRIQGELVLFFTSDAIFFSDVLTRQPHVIVVVNIPKSVVHHGVHQLSVAQAISLASIREKIWRVGHRLHATGDHDRTVASLDCLRRERDRFQSGAAYLVNRHGTHFGCKSAEQRRLPRRILTDAGGDDVAHDALVHLLRLQIRPLDSLAHSDCADLRRRHVTQAALKFSDRRAASRDDYYTIRTGHNCAPTRSFDARRALADSAS